MSGDTPLHGIGNRLTALADVKFLVDVFQVSFDGFRRSVEGLRASAAGLDPEPAMGDLIHHRYESEKWLQSLCVHIKLYI